MRPVFLRHGLLAAASLALFACAHAKTTDAQMPAQDEPTTGHGSAKAVTDIEGKPPRSTPRSTSPGERHTTPVAARPEGLLKPGSDEKIRDRLSQGGWLTEGKASTEAALRRFQGSHDLPTTGIPDHATIRKLGLNPDDVFRKAAP